MNERTSEVLVSTDWVAAHLDDPKVRIVESNEDPLLYHAGHVPGAVEIDWARDLNDPVHRDYLDRARFQALLRSRGIAADTTVVLYGDKSNWWAAYTLWVFKLFEFADVRLMDGGRLKWEMERRPLSRDMTTYPSTDYVAPERNDRLYRAFRDDVLRHIEQRGALIDVRSPEEYAGTRLHMEGYPNEGALRGGHIPGAHNVPWAQAVDPQLGTFRPREELRALYQEDLKLDPQQPIIAYCRIGERSSHTWFVLKYLLGFADVRNYDGSWTEWGNLVGAPIERPNR